MWTPQKPPGLIRHGRDGLLVPAGNAQALQLAVQLLVRQPSFMRELGVLAGLVPEWRRGGEPGGVTEAPSGAEAAAGA